MKFVLKPSLEHMTLVKIVISLWNQNDVRALISKFSCNDLYSRKWQKIEESVIEKVPQLSLPQPLKEKVFGVIKPIGIQIFEWMQYYNRYIWMGLQRTCLPAHLQAELCWTQLGTLDRKRTAEVLVRDGNLDVSTRYRVACDNCLEDDIRKFWNSITKDLRESVSCRREMFFWSLIMRRRGSHTSYKVEFRTCAGWGNKVAAEYFLQKLTPTERKASLVETAKYVTDADTLCLLLSEIDKEQQMEVFKKNPYKVLHSFLQWPFQSFFIEIVSFIWDFLSENNYGNMLKAILCKVRNGYKDCNYQMLFREFWQKSPSSLKHAFIDEIDNSGVLRSLFDTKDKEITRLILNDASFTVKKKLIYSEKIEYYLRDCIRENEWDFLEFFIRECFPSKSEMLKFKEKFEKCMPPNFKKHFATNKSNWDLMFSFSDDSIC